MDKEREPILDDTDDKDDDDLSKSFTYSYAEALKMTGYGKFHYILLALCGWSVSSDAVEVLSVSFLLPSAECDLQMSSADKGLLNILLFVGMMIGGYVWGSLADVQGRRSVLLWSLVVNGLGGLASSFAQSYWLFLLLRFISGLGVGGSMPVIFSYFSEFQSNERRGSMISLLATFWMCGNILAAGLAWGVIPHPSLGYFSAHFTYNSWRIFVALTTIPSLTSAVFYIFMPESPKFLLSVGKEQEAVDALRRVYNMNHSKSSSSYPVLRLEKIYNEDPRAKDSLLRHQSRRGCSQKIKNIKETIAKILESSASLFRQPHLSNTIVMLIIEFAICFGYYGLFLWFPELFKRLEVSQGNVCDAPPVPTSSNTSTLNNETCSNIGLNTNIYYEGMLTALSNLPGNLLTIFLIDRIGRKIMLATSMVISGLSVFIIYFVNNKSQSIIMSCVFGGFSTVGFNAIDVLQVELFPTQLRSTAFGLLAGVCRIGAILGNLIFGVLVDTNCAIPMLMVASLLAGGGLFAFKLPNMTRRETG